MSWRAVLDSDHQNFIKHHADDDVAALALKHKVDPIILDQIKVRQKARLKSPGFLKVDGFVFPPNDTYEQASSEACAQYKASLVSGESFVDLTAGSGADAFHISRRFERSVLVEKDAVCAEVLEHNSKALGLKNIDIKQYLAEDILKQIYPVDFIFIDPQRRENSKRGLYDFSACFPDVISLLSDLKAKAHRVMIKASPFLDIEKGIEDLGCVHEVHVVEWQGQCKEVLYLLNFASEVDLVDVPIRSVCISGKGTILKDFSFTFADEKSIKTDYSMPKKYIYEPGSGFMKAGGFKSLAENYSVSKLHEHSHLYTSDHICSEFPGKYYELIEVFPYKTKSLPIKFADVAVRNFPIDVNTLRKKFGLKDGGEHRLYATTLSDGQKYMLLCAK